MLDKDFWQDLKWKLGKTKYIDDLMEQVVMDVKEAEKFDNELLFYVGSDSQVYPKKKIIKYTIVLLLERTGRGCRIYNATKDVKFDKKQDRRVLARERLWNEVEWSVMISRAIEPKLMEMGYLINEVHADVNDDKKYLSNQMMASVLGYITSNGYVGKAKPDAWSASKAADHYC